MIGVAAFIAMIFIIVSLSPYHPASKSAGYPPFNMDSVVRLVKRDSFYDIKSVYYNKKDSSFDIAFSNKDNAIKDGMYSVGYFDSTYHLSRIASVEGIYLFAYDRKKSFIKGTYKGSLEYSSRRYGLLKAKFDSLYYESFRRAYGPMYDHVKARLDDPGSLEFRGSKNEGMNEDSTFEIKAEFRSKNQFGALVLHKISCNISMTGDVSAVVIDE